MTKVMDESLIAQDNAEGTTSPDVVSGMMGTVGEATAPSQQWNRALLPTVADAAAYTADQVTKAASLSTDLGITESVALDSLDQSIQRSKAKSIARNNQFAGWAAQSRKNAVIAMDDIEGLTPVFEGVQLIESMRSREKADKEFGVLRTHEPGFFESAGIALREGVEGVYDSMVGAGMMTSMVLEALTRTMGDEEQAKRYADERAQVLWQSKVKEERRPAQLEDAGYVADFLRTVPQFASQIGAAVATGGVGAMAFMGAQIGGGSFLNLRKKGVEEQRAFDAAVANAGIQAPLESIGLGSLGAILKTTGFANIVKKAAIGSLTEAATEFLQEYPDAATEIWALGEKQGRTMGESVQLFLNSFGDISQDALYSGLLALPFGLIGGGGRIAGTSRAKQYSDAHKSLSAAVDKAKVKGMSPDMTQDMLRQNGVANSLMPAEKVLEFYQSNPEFEAAFDIPLERVTEAAAMGQDIEIPTARLMSRLSKGQFDRIADKMRENPDAPTLSEADDKGRVAEDAKNILEVYEEQKRQSDEYDTAIEGLRSQLTTAVVESPGLVAQAQDAAGLVEFYKGFAERNFRTNAARTDFINRVSIQSAEQARISVAPEMVAEDVARLESLARDAGDIMLPPDSGPLPDLADIGDLMTAEEYHALQDQQALMDSMGITSGMSEIQKARKINPALDAIWGRLDGASLKRDYPGAFKEIVRNYGMGVFKSEAKGGLPVDVLADDLVRSNIFQEGMGANDIVDMLTAQRQQQQTLFQPAFHGSPFRFDKFSLEHLGTGEGAQAFGWGLYFAGDKAIAEWYRQTLEAKTPAIDFGGDRYEKSGDTWIDADGYPLVDEYKLAADMWLEHGGDVSKAIAELKEGEGVAGEILDIEDASKAISILENEEIHPVPTGQLYEVEIPESSEMLDLDSSLSEQSNAVKEALQKIESKLPTSALDDLGGDVSLLLDQEQTGADFYGTLSSLVGGPQSASVLLNSIGIKGNKYLDATSRTKDEGQHNFVVFDDTAVEVLRTYYQGQTAMRGAVRISESGYQVTLGPQSNISTLIHETGHIFEAELRRIADAGLADETQLADMRINDEWLSRFDNDAELKAEYDKYLKRLPGFGKAFTKLTSQEKEVARDSAKREYFARGMEEYVREGKAPSEGMRGIFSRFAMWLSQIYRKANGLGVELNDEMRGVFDRMIATENAIEQSAAINGLLELTQKELDAMGVKGTERNYQAALLEAAKRKAIDKLHAERNADRQERTRQYAKEAREELIEEPIYAARAEMRTKDGFLDADDIASVFGEDALRALRKSAGPGVARNGGQDIELFAARHGFADAATMMDAVTNAEGLGRKINQIVEAREADFDSSIDVDPILIETDEAARVLEIRAEYMARVTTKETLQAKAFILVAGEQLSKMQMSDAVQHGKFTAAMRRALRTERIEISKGNFDAALEANTQARLNMEFARQARELAKNQEGLTKKAKRFVGMEKGDNDAQFIVNDIAARFGMMKYNERIIGDRDASTIEAWFKARNDDGYVMFIDPFAMNGQKPLREMTVAEFGLVDDAITNVITIERHMRKLLTAADKADFKEAVGKATATTFSFRKPKVIPTAEEGGFIGRGLRLINASHTKIENLCIILDGGKALGDNYNLVYRPISDADNRRGVMFKGLDIRLQSKELFGAYTDKEKIDMSRKKEYIPAIGESLTKGQRIMVALNMGNEGNFERLVRGHNWSVEQIDSVVDTLDARDWKFVQAIWDTFESYKSESFALQEEVTGLRPTSVDARPLQTKYGDLRGGYFPVGYAKEHTQVELSDKTINNQNPAFGQSRHGHLKERTTKGAGTPLDLNMSRITSSLYDVITDLAFRKAFIDVGRVLKNKEYRHSIESTVGPEQYQAMVSWLKDAAKVNNPKTDGEGIARWARSSATFMAMGYKLTTIIAQPFGITQSIDVIGSKYTMQGINMAYGKGIRGMKEVSEWVKSVSPFMDQRIKSFDRDVSDATAEFSRKSLTPDNLISELSERAGMRRFEKFMKKNAFVPMGIVQYGVDLPTWLGAYQKGLQDFHGNEKSAIEYADSTVRISQGGGSIKDLARIQRGNEYAKLFTMFYSYFSTLYGRTAMRAADVNMNRDSASIIRAANSFLLLYIIPSVLTEIAAGRGPDDDEDKLGWAAKQLAMYPMQTVVGVRTMANIFDEFGYTASPGQAAPESMFNFLQQTFKLLTDPDTEFNAKKMAKLTWRATGYFSGLPVGQAEISAFNMWDYMDGTTGDFELRDLIFRKQKSRRGKK